MTIMTGCIPQAENDFQFVGIDYKRKSVFGSNTPVVLMVNGKEKAIAIQTLNDWIVDYPSDVELLKAKGAI